MKFALQSTALVVVFVATRRLKVRKFAMQVDRSAGGRIPRRLMIASGRPSAHKVAPGEPDVGLADLCAICFCSEMIFVSQINESMEFCMSRKPRDERGVTLRHKILRVCRPRGDRRSLGGRGTALMNGRRPIRPRRQANGGCSPRTCRYARTANNASERKHCNALQ